jgi:hypothetical protein
VHVNSSGVVAVSYYDFRNDVSSDGALTTDHWIVHSHDGVATWTENHLGARSTCTRHPMPAAALTRLAAVAGRPLPGRGRR